jgi:hypothetical protein
VTGVVTKFRHIRHSSSHLSNADCRTLNRGALTS